MVIIHRIRSTMNFSIHYFCSIWIPFILVFLGVASQANVEGKLIERRGQTWLKQFQYPTSEY